MKSLWIPAVLALAGCHGTVPAKEARALASVTITSANGTHPFRVELAKTAAEQERGLMFRTDIPKDGGMLFAPYPPEGGPPLSTGLDTRR